MIRLFFSTTDILDDTITLNKETSHYITSVLRIKENEKIEIIIDETIIKHIKVKNIDKTSLTFKVLKENQLTQTKIKNILIQGLPKQDKMSDIIRRCTEIGVNTIIPVITERSIPKLDDKKAENKWSRWQAVAKSAAEQSHRTSIPTIEPIQTIAQLLTNPLIQTADLKLVPWECERSKTLKEKLKENKKAQTICTFIGPEGGITDAEIEKLKQINFTPATIAETVLRTENAGFLTLANILYELNN